jgi:hypothetical protein
MNDLQFRDFKINKLVSDDRNPKKFEIIAWKVKEDCELKYQYATYKYKKGTLFIQLESGQIFCLKNPTESVIYPDKFQLNKDLIPRNLVEQVEIKDEKWCFPHLLKELKYKLNIND